jgi:hypothetical protein
LDDAKDRSIKIERAWRVQNQQVWKTYATAVERVADDLSKGPPIDSDEPRWATREKLMKAEVPGIIGGASICGPHINSLKSVHASLKPKYRVRK